MEVRILEEGPARRVLELTVPHAEVERHLDRVANELQRRTSMPGFRQGRAPRSLIESRFGSSLQDEAVESAVNEAFGQAAREQQLEPVGPARIEDVRYQPGEPLRFRAVVEVRPKVEAKDYRGIPLTRRVREVTEEDVDRALAGIREDTAQLLAVERPVGPTDVVVVDHVRIDEKGRTLKGSRTRDASLDLANEGLLPAFREGLAGAQAGESRTLQVQYPEDFGNPDLAGKAVRFHVKVKKIQEKKLRELDDNLAKEVFGLESLGDLRARIRLQMESEERLRSRHALEEDLVSDLLRRNPVPVPDGLAERLTEEALARATGGTELTQEQRLELLPRFRESMERRVAREWLLDAIAAQEKLEVGEEELAAEMARIAASRGRSAADFRALAPAERRARVRDALLERRIFDLLIEAASVQEEKIVENRQVVPA
jgi:trigger factor